MYEGTRDTKSQRVKSTTRALGWLPGTKEAIISVALVKSGRGLFRHIVR
jgi:hypothetical protein